MGIVAFDMLFIFPDGDSIDSSLGSVANATGRDAPAQTNALSFAASPYSPSTPLFNSDVNGLAQQGTGGALLSPLCYHTFRVLLYISYHS